MASDTPKRDTPTKDEELPGTLQRSPAKAKRTYKKTLESAEEEYGKGERAGRTAYASLKHSFEKVGDHWETKDRKGPSDTRAQGSRTTGQTAGGVDVEGHSRKELLDRARSLGISGLSRMTKMELGRAIASKQD